MSKIHIFWLSLQNNSNLFIMKLSKLIPLCAVASAFCACSSPQVKAPEAILPIPEQKQVDWQKMETYAFIHFGLNTFNDREWGYGDTDPKIFNPARLDCEQWAQTLVKAGMKGVILTAKHHDGFCLWPFEGTDYNISHTPYKDGKGDIVRELADACKKYGLKFAVYLSPWDRHQANYGTPEYLDYFYAQLRELLTNYGEVFEVWFDGANGGDGWYGGAKDVRTIDRKNYYNYPRIYEILDSIQPQAVIFSDGGPGCRWVGNERGFAGATNWSFLRKGEVYPGYPKHYELQYGHADGNQWVPAECDVSIRPGWFYHKNEDSKVKSLKQLVDIYFQSVGYNSVLLLNIPPDTRGLIHETDIQRLKEFAEYRKQTFADNKIRKGNRYWNVSPGDELTYRLKKNAEFNVVMLQEDITKGQRVEKFTLEALTDKGWTEIAQGTTVGYKRLLRFPTVKATRLRVRIDECRLSAHIKQVAAYYAPPLQEEGTLESWNTLPRSGWKVLSDTPLVIDLGKNVTISSFTYAPYKAEPKPSIAYRYTLYTSTDGKTWKKIVEDGEFSNIMNNPIPQTVTFEEKVRMRFIKMEATTMEGDNAKIDMKEIGVTVITD